MHPGEERVLPRVLLLLWVRLLRLGAVAVAEVCVGGARAGLARFARGYCRKGQQGGKEECALWAVLEASECMVLSKSRAAALQCKQQAQKYIPHTAQFPKEGRCNTLLWCAASRVLRA